MAVVRSPLTGAPSSRRSGWSHDPGGYTLQPPGSMASVEPSQSLSSVSSQTSSRVSGEHVLLAHLDVGAVALQVSRGADSGKTRVTRGGDVVDSALAVVVYTVADFRVSGVPEGGARTRPRRFMASPTWANSDQDGGSTREAFPCKSFKRVRFRSATSTATERALGSASSITRLTKITSLCWLTRRPTSHVTLPSP